MNDDIPSLLEKARGEVDRVRDDLSAGQLSQAGDLGLRVDELMQALQKLPKEEAEQYLETLDDLQNTLGTLAEEYRNLAEAAKGGLNRINTVSQASSAYAQRGAELGTAEAETVSMEQSESAVIDIEPDERR